MENIDHIGPTLNKQLETEVAPLLDSELTRPNLQSLNSGLWKKAGLADSVLNKDNLHSSELSPNTVVPNPPVSSFLSYDNVFNTTQLVQDYELKNNSGDKMIIPAEQSVRYQLGNSPQLPKRSNLNHSAS